MKTTLCIALLLLLVALSTQHLACRTKDSACALGKNQCCGDLKCRKQFSWSTKTTCQPTDDSGELCGRPDDDCTPLPNSCCSGLKCTKNRLNNYKCEIDI